jgi:hypothetical protein
MNEIPKNIIEKETEPKKYFGEFIQSGFVEINGVKEQISIGEIKEVDDYIEVEVLGGCKKVALIDTMHKIAEKYGKTVKAEHNFDQIVIEPEDTKEDEK